jgi:predicted DCC family thiol-disulfide oxidoreductase YuxK
MDETTVDPEDHPVLLFDGVCNLCNGVVQFLVPRDPAGVLRFASLQSDAGQRLLDAHDVPVDDLETVVLLDGRGYHLKSEAVVRVAEHLGGVYALASALRLVPRSVRDRLYDLVAEHRYRVFGRREQCMVPSPDVEDRFLD